MTFRIEIFFNSKCSSYLLPWFSTKNYYPFVRDLRGSQFKQFNFNWTLSKKKMQCSATLPCSCSSKLVSCKKRSFLFKKFSFKWFSKFLPLSPIHRSEKVLPANLYLTYEYCNISNISNVALFNCLSRLEFKSLEDSKGNKVWIEYGNFRMQNANNFVGRHVISTELFCSILCFIHICTETGICIREELITRTYLPLPCICCNVSATMYAKFHPLLLKQNINCFFSLN